jgi:hypothetical protein
VRRTHLTGGSPELARRPVMGPGYGPRSHSASWFPLRVLPALRDGRVAAPSGEFSTICHRCAAADLRGPVLLSHPPDGTPVDGVCPLRGGSARRPYQLGNLQRDNTPNPAGVRCEPDCGHAILARGLTDPLHAHRTAAFRVALMANGALYVHDLSGSNLFGRALPGRCVSGRAAGCGGVRCRVSFRSGGAPGKGPT